MKWILDTVNLRLRCFDDNKRKPRFTVNLDKVCYGRFEIIMFVNGSFCTLNLENDTFTYIDGKVSFIKTLFHSKNLFEFKIVEDEKD